VLRRLTFAGAADATEIERAVALLKRGELVAFPTETVYGLGADAANPAAVAKIFAAKGRPADHPLIVHLPSAEHLARWAREVPAEAERLAAAFWPGPLTLILKRQPQVPDAVTGGQDTVGLRVPSHPLALELLAAFDGGDCRALGQPLRPHQPDHRRPRARGVRRTRAAGARRRRLPGRHRVDHPRSVARRAGAAAPRCQSARRTSHGCSEAHPKRHAPHAECAARLGQPRCPLRAAHAAAAGVFRRPALCAAQCPRRRRKVAVLAPTAQAISHDLVTWKQSPAEPAGFAHDLYASLRELDALGCARLLVQQPPAGENWLAVNDRLRRAAAGSGEDDET
jgi:L-threonylcarbamoyladenylate synthase